MRKSQERAAQWPYDRVLAFWRPRVGEEEAKVQAYRERNAAICRAAAAGVSFVEIGRIFGMSGCNASLVVAKSARQHKLRIPIGLEYFDVSRAVATIRVFENQVGLTSEITQPRASELRRRLRELQAETNAIKEKLRPVAVKAAAAVTVPKGQPQTLTPKADEKPKPTGFITWIPEFTEAERELIAQAHPSAGSINPDNGAIRNHLGSDVLFGRMMIRPAQALVALGHGWSAVFGSCFAYHPDAWVVVERSPDAHIKAAVATAKVR